MDREQKTASLFLILFVFLLHYFYQMIRSMKRFHLTLITLFISFCAFAQTPAPITGVAQICPGAFSALSDTTPGGFWTSSSPAIATVSTSGVIVGLTAGTANISYTTGTGYATIVITVNPLPNVYALTGGGSSCTGASFHIGLSGSETGVSYSLYNGTTALGAPVSGTGTSLDFGAYTYTGTYTAIAVNSASGCSRNMTGSASIGVGITAYSIYGGGAICPGGIGLHIGLTSSYPGISYQLMRGGTAVGAALAGTGSSIDFGFDSTAGTYTVLATNVTTTCTMNMAGSAIISVGTTPVPYSVTGGGSVCSGGTGVHIGLNGSGSGINYQLCAGGMPVGASLAGTGTSFDFGLQSVPGTYTVIGVNTATGCTGNMAGAAIISLITSTCSGLPSAGAASVSMSSYCSGLADTLKLTGNTTACGISFQWQSSPDGISWTNISGASNTYNTIFPSAPLYYRNAVTCSSSGLTAYSGSAYLPLSHGIYDHHVTRMLDTICNPPDFYISACGVSSTYNVTTFYGDGNSDNIPLTTTGLCHADCYHNFSAPGTYSIKQVLYDGSSALDSITFTYEYMYCSVMPVYFYFDVNSDCIFDSSDRFPIKPLLAEIDSNGVPVDTICTISGFYYYGLGPIGTIYGFKLITGSDGYTLSCPSPGIIYDTVQSYTSGYLPKYIGLSCIGTGTLFDLYENTSVKCGRHMSNGTIVVGNYFCAPTPATVSVTFSPKYEIGSGYVYPTPASVSGNVITWNLASLSSSEIAPSTINYTVNVPGAWLLPGDTIQTKVFIGSLLGDADTLNNVTIRVDTVKSSYDPNELSVSPQGNIIPCTPLQYTINFENTGNDTARNISVLDTLSPNLDPKSLRIIAASSAMNIAIFKSGGLNIVKFDFPGINLPDSSHHSQCDGMVVFTVKALNGLADGSNIANEAGIYFDDNPVIMTNSVANLTGISPITGAGSLCVAANTILTDATPGGTWSLSNSHAFLATAPQMAVSGKTVIGYSAGTDTLMYTVSNTCTSRTVKQAIVINPPPAAISGSNQVCTGATTILGDVSTGGKWISNNPAVSLIDSITGIMSGIASGNDTITYTLLSGCATQKLITVNALPDIYSMTGGGSYCTGGLGAHIGLSGSDSLLHYQLYNGLSVIGSSLTATGTAIDFGVLTSAGTYSAIATNPVTGCKSNMAATAVISLLPLPDIYTVISGGSFCAGDTGVHVRLSGSAPGISYQLYIGIAMIGSPATGTGSSLDFGLIATAGTYSVTATNIATSCASNMAAAAVVNINPLPAVFTLTGGGSYCAGGAGADVSLTGSSTGISYQLFNGSATGSPTAGTGAVLDFGTLTTPGTYTAVGTNLATGCHVSMTSSATININPLPAVFTIVGGGSHCAGDTGVHISLTGSATGVNYQLLYSGAPAGAVLPGNGSTLNFGLLTAAGIYTAAATDTTHLCTTDMTGSAVIDVIPNVTPAVSITNDAPDFICLGTLVTYTASAVNGGTSPSYHWNVNGIIAGIGGTYAYYPVNGDIVTAVLTSDAVCPFPASVTTGMSMAVDSSYNPVVTIVSSNHGKLAIGQADTFTAVVTNAGPYPAYQWSVNGNTITGATSSVFIYSGFYDNDMVNCEVKGSTLCGTWGTSNSIQIQLQNVGIRSLYGNESVALYPNPNTGVFSLKGTTDFAAGDVCSLSIRDIIGQKIFQSDIKVVNGIINEKIDLTKLHPALNGMYILTLVSGNGSREFNFIITK